MRHVIIGGSIAGLAAAKSIRSMDSEAEIVVISAEQGKPYYRPLIPYLIEKTDRDIDFIEDPFEQYGLRRENGSVTSVNTESREVMVNSGSIFSYDRLLISAGGNPIIPGVEGLDGPGAFTLRTRNDALSIHSFSQGKKEALVIGAGLVGIKAAIALKNLGLNVTLVEQFDRILSGRIDRRGAGIILNALMDNGYKIILEDTVASITRSGDAVKGVNLSSGTQYETDLIIVAAGVKPNISFLKGSGISVNKGIVINELLQTSAPDVYAAGDVVEYIDTASGEAAVSALWSNAEEMGRFAGMNMAGKNIMYRGFLSTMNSSDILGIPFISAGIIEPDESKYDVIVDDRIDSYRKLVFRDDILAGFVFLGDITGAGIYTNLVRNRIAIGDLKSEAISGSLEYIDFMRTADTSHATM